MIKSHTPDNLSTHKQPSLLYSDTGRFPLATAADLRFLNALSTLDSLYFGQQFGWKKEKKNISSTQMKQNCFYQN